MRDNHESSGAEREEQGYDPKKRPKTTEYFGLMEVVTYFFRKKDPDRPSNFNIRAMHTINKISMGIFLVCVIVLIVRALG